MLPSPGTRLHARTLPTLTLPALTLPVIVALLLGAGAACAEPTLSAGLAYGTAGALRRVDVGFSTPSRYSGDWRGRPWELRWLGEIGTWNARHEGDQRARLFDVGAGAAFRVALPESLAMQPYVELALGVHYLTEHDLGNRKLSTRLQFGEVPAVGVRFGPRREWGLALTFRHESNAGLKIPNSGLTVWGARLEYALP